MNNEEIKNYYEYDEFMKKEDLAEELQPYYTNNDCCSYIVKLRKEKTDLQQENEELKENCEDLFNQKEMMFKNMQLNQLKVCELAKVLNEVREYITNNRLFNFVPDEEELFEYASDGKAKSELLQILAKANEQKW